MIFSLLFILLTSCKYSGVAPEASLNILDRVGFEVFGGTFFIEPTRVTMKEIHLDNGSLKGRPVIIEGEVVQTSRYSTFMVLEDATGKILVVITELNSGDIVKYLPKDKNSKMNVRVLGTLETGKKGVPYLMAKALSHS